jgi:type II secretory pathway pseudopilin PulG
MIVIAVVGILAAGLITLINPVGQMQRTRDSRRKAELKQIQTALELYRSDCGYYPSTIPSEAALTSNCTGSLVTYSSNIPKDPGPYGVYDYVPSPAGCSGAACTAYALSAYLEKDVDPEGYSEGCGNSPGLCYTVYSP